MTRDDTEIIAAALVDELKELRKGSTMLIGPLSSRLGPNSRAAFEVFDLDAEDTIRAKVLSRMRSALTSLPDGQAVAVSAAFGLDPAYPGQFYKDRLAALAAVRLVDSRTVRRWVDRALPTLAKSLLSSASGRNSEPTWWTDQFKLALVLGPRAAEAFEVRKVIAACDGLAALDIAHTITDADPRTVLDNVSFDVIYGGTLTVGPMESSDRIGLALTLPRPLMRGDAHEYALRTRIPAAHELRPHYVCVPNYHCGWLEVRVRFSPDNVPRRVEKLVNVHQRDIDDPAITTEDVPVDAAGEVFVSFGELTAGRASGVRWAY